MYTITNEDTPNLQHGKNKIIVNIHYYCLYYKQLLYHPKIPVTMYIEESNSVYGSSEAYLMDCTKLSVKCKVYYTQFHENAKSSFC